MSATAVQFLQRWVVTTLAVLVAVNIVRGLSYDGVSSLLVASLLLGFLNAFVRPLLWVISLPLLLYTLGLQNWRHYAVFAERFVEAGLPRPAVIAAVALGSQLLGAGLLAAGLLTRLAALCVALTMSLEVYAFHRGFPPSVGQIIPMGYAVAAFGILLIGPGRASLDHLFFRRGG